MDLEWMAWTRPTAIFFIAVAAMLTFTTILGLRSPSVARKGFLPLVTTRGERLYIGLLGVAFVNLAWLGFTDLNQWLGAAIAFVLLALVLRWG